MVVVVVVDVDPSALYTPPVGQASKMSNLCMLATIRKLPGLLCRFSPAVQLEISASDADIERYLMARMPRLTPVLKDHKTLPTEIISRIVTSADGMYVRVAERCTMADVDTDSSWHASTSMLCVSRPRESRFVRHLMALLRQAVRWSKHMAKFENALMDATILLVA